MANYDEAIDWLDDNFPFFLTLVLNLGEPTKSTKIPKAAIVDAPKSKNGWEFLINQSFFENMTPAEMAGVISHETLHVALSHLSEKRDKDRWSRPQLLTIAQEIIINDRLEEEGFILPEDCFRGIDQIDQSAAPYSTQECYDILVEKNPDESKDEQKSQEGESCQHGENLDGDGSGEDGQGEPTLSEGVAQALAAKILQSAANASPEDKDDISQELLDQLNASVSDDMVTKSNVAGDQGDIQSVDKTAKRLGIKVAWARLLSQVNPDILRRPSKSYSSLRSSWRSPRRALAHMYPEVMVPVLIDKEKGRKSGNHKPLIVLALDFSGSIPDSMQEILLELALSIPDTLVEVECCTFSTIAVPFNPKSADNKRASGGTDFGCVEMFAREAAARHGLKYPKAIVCITDGQAGFGYDREPINPDAWKWTMISSGDRLYCQEKFKAENTLQLSDFVDNVPSMY